MKLLCLLLTGTLLCGCEPSRRSLIDGYVLERFDENGKYYVIAPNDNLSGGGVFDGTVEEIGWNQQWILARVTRLYHGDTNGWYALDLKTKQLAGPIQVISNTAFATIKCYPAEEIGRKR